jgi:hypothetical protein
LFDVLTPASTKRSPVTFKSIQIIGSLYDNV